MSFRTYAFRIGQDADLLDDEEWARIAPLLKDRHKGVMKTRKETGCSLSQALILEPNGQAALDLYETLTGTRLTHPDQLFGLRMRDYGAPCPKCTRPFRTPNARRCAECGFQLPNGSKAGALTDSL